MIFTIHGTRSAAGIVNSDTLTAVPEANAKWALIFPPLWLVRHQLWFALAIYFLIGIIMLGLLFTRLLPAALLLAGIPGIYLYLEGNQLRRIALERSGMEMLAAVDAEDDEAALIKYAQVESEREPVEVESTAVAPTRQRVGNQPQAFGLFPEAGY